MKTNNRGLREIAGAAVVAASAVMGTMGAGEAKAALYKIDVQGTFQNVPAGTTVRGQAVTDGTTFDAIWYFDPANVTTLSGSTHLDGVDGNSQLVIGGNYTAPAIGLTPPAQASVYLPSEIFLTSRLAQNADYFYADLNFTSGTLPDASFNSTLSALQQFGTRGTSSQVSVIPDTSLVSGPFISGSVDSVTVAAIPEPTSMGLLLGGAGAIMLRRRHRKHLAGIEKDVEIETSR